MENIKLYAVTGGIGSGKTTVMEILAELGYRTISCDEEIKNLYKENSVKEMLAVLFPTAVKNGEIDRKEISKIVFNNKEKLEKLNNYIHPLVMERCIKLAKDNNKQGIAFIEVPLLFESRLENMFKGTIVVLRDKKQRIESVKLRSKLNEQEIEERMNNQVNYDSINLANYEVITNNGDIKELREKIIEKITKILP